MQALLRKNLNLENVASGGRDCGLWLKQTRDFHPVLRCPCQNQQFFFVITYYLAVPTYVSCNKRSFLSPTKPAPCERRGLF